jgi:type I restriction enzyme S subunit
LRFPGFEGEWEETPLTKYLEFKNGLNSESKNYGKGIKYISVMDVLNNDYITYDNIIGLVDVDSEIQKRYEVNYGDILFQRSSETFEDIGQANVYLDNKPAVFGGFVIRGKKIGEYNPKFFRYLLSSPNARKKIIIKGAGSQHYNIGQDGLSTISLFFPTIIEQEKIATFLSLIDDRISTQSKILERYKSLIKALNDFIFDDIQNKVLIPFSELYEKAGEGGTPDTKNSEYYENGQIPFVKIDDLNNKYLENNQWFISEEGLRKSSAWIVPSNSILYSNGATIGAISINKYPVATKQGILGIVIKNNVLVEYMFYFMSSKYFRREICRITTHGTMKTAYIKDIDTIKCYLPDYKIQMSIVKILNVLTSKIEIEQLLIKKLEQQKQYLLYQMFI